MLQVSGQQQQLVEKLESVCIVGDDQDVTSRNFLCGFWMPLRVLSHVENRAACHGLSPIMEQFGFSDPTSASKDADHRCRIREECIQLGDPRVATTERLLEVEKSGRARFQLGEEFLRRREGEATAWSPF